MEYEKWDKILVPYEQSKIISKGEQRSFNGGYLFLQKIYHELKLDKIYKEISQKYKFDFDLDSILSRLIYSHLYNRKRHNPSQAFTKVGTFEDINKKRPHNCDYVSETQ